MHMQENTTASLEAIVAACFIACLAATAVFAELFHSLVDEPSKALAHCVFDWLRE